MLLDISDRRVRRLVAERAGRLSEEPEKQGGALRDSLRGFRSIRAVGQRYRIIYRIVDGQEAVTVVAAGIRREGDGSDIYAVAQRLFRLGLLE